MTEAMLSGLKMMMDVQVLGLMVLATFIGNFFGAIPGLGGTLGLALLIPFVYGMQPFAGLAFLLSMHSVVHTGGSIPGILFGIPGTGGTVATILDGHPLTKMGRGGEAMGAQLAASAVGGVIGAAVLALLIPVLKPIAMACRPAEIFMLIVFGLTFIVILSRESIIKGFTTALIGLLLGTVGLDPHSGVGRFTFDQLWLWDGINLVVLVLGIFAFSEMIELGARGRRAQIAEGDISMPWSQLWEGTKAVFREWWLTLRTAIIGTFIGIIPGLGADPATWICYGHAVQTCKNNENFGKGDIRGVIGVETANNAKEGGALLPTLVFGIPGSSGMAILLGAFLVLGIVPGPKMITQNLDLVWGMVWVLVFANIIGAVTLYPLCGYMGRLAFLRGSLLIPAILEISAIGAFLVRGIWQDVVLAVFFGFFGYAMKKWKYPAAPLILGFILGPLAENYLHKSLGIWGIAFLIRPLVLILLLFIFLSLSFTIWQTYRERMNKKKETIRVKGESLLALVILSFFFWGLYLCIEWEMKTRLFPLLIVTTGIVLSASQFISILISPRPLKSVESEVKEDIPTSTFQLSEKKETPKREAVMIVWMFAFLTMHLVLGFWISIAGFTAIFMYIFGRERWKTIMIYSASLWLASYLIFCAIMDAPLYGGIYGLSW